MDDSKGVQNLQDILESVDKAVNSKIISAAVKIYNTLRSSPPAGTPIDTGWASSNWVASIDKPEMGLFGSKKNVLRQNPSIGVIYGFDINRHNSIYITNNVPYMNRLNSGWSKQSPAGFVEAAIDAAMIDFMAGRK